MPRDPAHGDMATNTAMMFAKDARMKPRRHAPSLRGPRAPSEAKGEAGRSNPVFMRDALDCVALRSSRMRGHELRARNDGQERHRHAQPGQFALRCAQ
jgi:hypothetical protein